MNANENYPDWIEGTRPNPSSPEYSEKPSCEDCASPLKIEHGDHETPTLTWCDNSSCDLFESNV